MLRLRPLSDCGSRRKLRSVLREAQAALSPSRGTSRAQDSILWTTSLLERYNLYPTHQLISWLQRPARWKLATKTSTAISILFLGAIVAVGMTSMKSFREQLMNVLLEEQDTLVERVADNLDQRLLALRKALVLSAIEITEADMA